MTVRLYVGNLPKESVDRDLLQAVFTDAGEVVSTKVIKDRKTGKCRGFAFVTVPSDDVADAMIEKCNGQSFMDSPLKIEKAMPRDKSKGSEDDSSGAAAVPTPSKSSKKGGKKRSRSQGNNSHSGGDSFQPDPRWAGELAKLREMLAAAQATK